MMILKRKEEGRVCTILLHYLRNSPMPSKNILTAVLYLKRHKFGLGFEPGLLRQNANAIIKKCNAVHHLFT